MGQEINRRLEIRSCSTERTILSAGGALGSLLFWFLAVPLVPGTALGTLSGHCARVQLFPAVLPGSWTCSCPCNSRAAQGSSAGLLWAVAGRALLLTRDLGLVLTPESLGSNICQENRMFLDFQFVFSSNSWVFLCKNLSHWDFWVLVRNRKFVLGFLKDLKPEWTHNWCAVQPNLLLLVE